MRVIAGSARSLKLKTIEGNDTRPTTDKIKETLFNMLMAYIPDAEFLDLFAGSGAIGIEALSRGAAACTFIEQNVKAVACINDNLKFTRLDNMAMVLRRDVISFVRELPRVAYDVIFMDPPYKMGLERDVLELLSKKEFKNDTLIVVEAALDEDFGYLDSMGYDIIKEKKYKTNKHIFIEKKD